MSSTPSADANTVGEGFLAAWTGERGVDEAPRIGRVLIDACAACRAGVPGLEIDEVRFARFVGERAPATGGALEVLGALQLPDLYLACGCLAGAPAAIARFEETCIAQVPRYLARLQPTPSFVDEVRQLLRTRLLVADGANPPRIGQFAGRGSLGAWVRMAAMRTALNTTTSERAHAATDEILEDAVLDAAAPAQGFEADYLRAHYRPDVTAVFRESLAALETRARLVLRLHYVDRLTPGAIGQLYGVHRTTAQRWIETAEAELLAGVRAGLSARLRLSSTECDSLLGLLKSQLEVSLSPLLDASGQGGRRGPGGRGGGAP